MDGNKGVIAKIIPDSEAPVDAYGRHAEIILNAYGINNRMNWSQAFEQAINFMSDHVQHEIIKTDNDYLKSEIFFEYLRLINPHQYFYFRNVYSNLDLDGKKDFIKSIENDGIYIHQYPFYGNAKSSGSGKEIPEFDEYLTRIRNTKKNKDKAEIYLEYLRKVDEMNPCYINDEADFDEMNDKWNEVKNYLVPVSGFDENEEENWFREFYAEFSDQDKKEFWNDISDYGPLFRPNLITIAIKHPEWLVKYKSPGIELPITIGEEYFILLKHNKHNKTSVRSVGKTSQKKMPLKTNTNKTNSSQYPDTANRIGRMELNNLLIVNDAALINKLMREYSTNEEDRHALIKALLTSNNPFELKTFISEQPGIPRVQLDEYLKILDLELID